MRVIAWSLTILLLAASAVRADGWKTTLSSHSLGPERIVAIDKASQTLFLLEQRSPLHMKESYPCTTGQVEGDKLVRGDMRTPEGVYFLGGRIGRKLDWTLYGNVAYSLNYPNPVDRIKGKTGYGIWLHGRGKTLVPRDTLGCVALKNPDIQALGDDITPGTPVLIASDLKWTPKNNQDDPLAEELAEQVRIWASDWEKQGQDFLDHYNPALMTLSENSDFRNFAAHKRNVFAAKPWIHVVVDNIHVMPGPDYWVTWFDQYYRTTGLISQTGKRFYWQRDTDGKWRIVGREFTPASQDLEPRYLSRVSTQAEELVRTWAEAWRGADIDVYTTCYADDAMQDGRRGPKRIAEYKKALWEEKPPVKLEVEQMEIALHPRGLKVNFLQKYSDASGYSDVGVKTLVLAPRGRDWKIQSEHWRRSR
ncbi:L,D-transpeptidase Cds6 family protein [Pseudodesulfovibrio tunisiensis]|uniref:L,D-transpeptidase Cds6 family protein n=1 Tax=Pseudodesulfovibrio tunisiensis TaxID=463192 RepID=UPI001FB44546|nr:L,D-transpeptidase family protein [Pseudodesulfovibrio tunisiensis]